MPDQMKTNTLFDAPTKPPRNVKTAAGNVEIPGEYKEISIRKPNILVDGRGGTYSQPQKPEVLTHIDCDSAKKIIDENPRARITKGVDAYQFNIEAAQNPLGPVAYLYAQMNISGAPTSVQFGAVLLAPQKFS